MQEQQTSDQVHLSAPSGSAQSVRPLRIASGGTAASVIVAALAAMMGRTHAPATPRKDRKPFPVMVCSPPEEIAAWNAAVDKRSTRRARILMRRERAA